MRKYTYLIVSLIATGLIILVGEVLALKNQATGFWTILCILVASSAIAALVRWRGENDPKNMDIRETIRASALSYLMDVDGTIRASTLGGLGCLIEASVFAVYVYVFLGCDETAVLLLMFGAFVVLAIPPVVIAAITNIKQSR